MNDAFLQIRTALDSTTEVTGGDARSGVGAVFIQKEIDRMIVETYNNGVDFSPLVPRKSMRQLAYIWNLRINRGSTSKVTFYADGAGGIKSASIDASGVLNLQEGTASKAPIKFTAGTSLTTEIAGVMEFDGTDLFITI